MEQQVGQGAWAQRPWVREESQRPLKCSIGTSKHPRFPLPSFLWGWPCLPELPPQHPDTRVTSTTSWHSVLLDMLLVLVTLCPLGPEPDSACSRRPHPCSEQRSRRVWESLPGLSTMGPVSYSAWATNAGCCAPRPAPPLSCLYFPSDMTPHFPEPSLSVTLILTPHHGEPWGQSSPL